MLHHPFYQNLVPALLQILATKKITRYIYLEHEKNLSLQLPDNLKIIKEKITGDVAYKLLLFLDAHDTI